jgi:hypothetical protein
MDPVVKKIAEALEKTPEQWKIDIRIDTAKATHPTGIEINLFDANHPMKSFIQLAPPLGGTHVIGFWAKQRLWALLDEAVKTTLSKRTQDRLGGFKFCPYCGRPVGEKKEE